MTELWILVLGVGFFAVCVLYVTFCHRIVGPDEAVPEPAVTDEEIADTHVEVVGR